MPRLALALLVIAGLAAGADEAARSMPDVPDPYGLGPRLALVDYLKDQLHAQVEPGATYEALVAQYWTIVDQPKADADAERKDRIRQLQFRLKTEFGLDASANEDEATLRALIAAQEKGATVRVSDHPGTDEHAHHAEPGPPAPGHAPKPQAPPVAGGWLDSYADAVAASQASGRPILIDFTGSDWCVWCKRLHQEVFDQAEFQRWASGHVVLLELDFPKEKQLAPVIVKQNADLAEKYQVKGYPTILVIDANGRLLGRSGYRKGGADAWIAELQQHVGELRK